MATILIIDDEPQELALLRDMLAADGYRFEMATGQHDARRLVETHGKTIRAILLDWILEGLDPVELMHWIKNHPQLTDVEVVVQSTEFVPEDIRAGLANGAYFYLTKPFDPDQLRAIVRAAVAACDLKRSLTKRITACEDTVRLLESGTFRFRTPQQAEILAVHLGSATGEPQRGVGLLELMINAIEHGNLGITYDEKGELRRQGNFRQEVSRRLALPEYRDRWATVEVAQRGGEIEIEIRDTGEGFDFERYLQLDHERLFHAHGRGVLLATAALDLEYLPPGNRVRVRMPVAPGGELLTRTALNPKPA